MEYKWKLLRPKYAVECPVCHKVYSLFSPLTNECDNCHTHLFEIDYGEVAKTKKKTNNSRYTTPRKKIQARCQGSVYTLREFAKLIAGGYIIEDDGLGYFHDGKRETNIDVFSSRVSFAEACKKYPYVCWYNK